MSSCSTWRRPGSRANGRDELSSPKRYPRTARVNEVMLEVLADELERMSDPRLELVTLTGVDVSRDLAHAKVYYSTMTATAIDDRAGVSDDAAAALRAAGSHLRGVVGREMRIRQVPRLDFVVDSGIVSGQRIEDILREIHQREAQARDDGVAGDEEES
jgi:ribosome-binding factor A